ncbi:hypothetical protein TNCV_2377081 [Trichonephila clavipes]|nr:hypothetical protein TNCV_2377081 [Trichonephila clavipes]
MRNKDIKRLALIGETWLVRRRRRKIFTQDVKGQGSSECQHSHLTVNASLAGDGQHMRRTPTFLLTNDLLWGGSGELMACFSSQSGQL